MSNQQRHMSFGESKLSLLDKIIYNLRIRSLKPHLDCNDKLVADFGCGFNADFLRYIKTNYGSKKNIAVDLKLNTKFLESMDIDCVECDLNQEINLPYKVDRIFATAILEHLNNPVGFLKECHKNLNEGGVLYLTTPSIRSQPVLEFMAFKLKIISRVEIEDHKEYFDKKRLLEYLKMAGFDLKKVHHEYFEMRMNNLIVVKK